ncbi:hypothetical protein Bpro_4586 [Polaromonas sp. JS666]|nr:hypothetical protein Bpro_4586 [Polaromonas sp. JS666]
MKPPIRPCLMDSTMRCNGSSASALVGARLTEPARAAANTRPQRRPNWPDSCTSAANEVSSSGRLSTHISGTSAPPWPALKRSRCTGVLSSGSSTPANTNSRRCGSGWARAACSRSSKLRMSMGSSSHRE